MCEMGSVLGRRQQDEKNERKAEEARKARLSSKVLLSRSMNLATHLCLKMFFSSLFYTFTPVLHRRPHPISTTCLRSWVTLWLPFCCYALLHVGCVRSWCSLIWNPDRMLMLFSPLVQLFTVCCNRLVRVCFYQCLCLIRCRKCVKLWLMWVSVFCFNPRRK